MQIRKGDWYEFLGAIHESVGDLPGRHRLDGKSGTCCSGEGSKQYVVIFSAEDEAYSELLDCAEKYRVTSAHFTAIGALSRVVLGWFDPEKKMYRENQIDEQVEVATMTGDFALYQGKPALHTHIVVGRRDGTASGGHLIEAIVSPQHWKSLSPSTRLRCRRNTIRRPTLR